MITYEKPIKKISTDKTLGYCYFIDKEHPLADKIGKVYYHRHIMSLSVGRWIKSDEHVHHIDENRSNNLIENLSLTNSVEHIKYHHPKTTIEMNCVFCGKLFSKKPNSIRRFCSHKCREESNFAKKFVIAREELHNAVWSMPSTEVGKIYGVRGKSIERRCRKLGVEKPPAGYWQKVEFGHIKPIIPPLKPLTPTPIDIPKIPAII